MELKLKFEVRINGETVALYSTIMELKQPKSHRAYHQHNALYSTIMELKRTKVASVFALIVLFIAPLWN